MIDDIGIRAKGESTSAVDLVPLWRMSGDEFEDLGIQGYDSGVEIVENMMYGNPTAFLFDEPLSNLDAKLCVPMHAEIQRLQKQTGITSI